MHQHTSTQRNTPAGSSARAHVCRPALAVVVAQQDAGQHLPACLNQRRVRRQVVSARHEEHVTHKQGQQRRVQRGRCGRSGEEDAGVGIHWRGRGHQARPVSSLETNKHSQRPEHTHIHGAHAAGGHKGTKAASKAASCTHEPVAVGGPLRGEALVEQHGPGHEVPQVRGHGPPGIKRLGHAAVQQERRSTTTPHHTTNHTTHRIASSRRRRNHHRRG
jgi:hypothetical protein